MVNFIFSNQSSAHSDLVSAVKKITQN